MSQSEILAETNDPAPAPPRSGSGFARSVIVAAVVVLVAGPILWSAVPEEMARWSDAEAYEKYLSGDVRGAIEILNSTIATSPGSAARFRQRAEYRRAAGDYVGSLEDYEAALGLSPNDKKLQAAHATALQHAGQHKEAVEFHESILKRALETGASDQTRVSLLNAVAYARGVGNIELSEGLAQADEAANLLGADAFIWEQAGYLHMLFADWKIEKNKNRKRGEAKYTDDEIAADRRRAIMRLHEAEEMLESQLDGPKPEVANIATAKTSERTRIKVSQERLAAVQYHLGKLYSSLGDTESAEKYSRLAAAWGEPERTLRQHVPSFAEAWQRGGQACAIIDTRGYLRLRLGKYQDALRDLDLAFDLALVQDKFIFENLHRAKSEVYDIRQHRLDVAEARKNTAVILYHRALTYEKLGEADKAASDLRRVKVEFGATPDEHLF